MTQGIAEGRLPSDHRVLLLSRLAFLLFQVSRTQFRHRQDWSFQGPHNQLAVDACSCEIPLRWLVMGQPAFVLK